MSAAVQTARRTDGAWLPSSLSTAGFTVPALSDAKRLVVNAGAKEKNGKCLAAGTLIPLSSGVLAPVETVRVGDGVLSFHHQEGVVARRVVEARYDGTRPTFLVRLSDGSEIRATSEHRFLRNYGEDNGWASVRELHPGDLLAVPCQVPQVSAAFNGSCFHLPHVADFLGYMTADGGLTSTSAYFTKNEQALVEDFKSHCEALGFVVNPIPKDGRNRQRPKRAQSWLVTAPQIGKVQDVLRYHQLWGCRSAEKVVGHAVMQADEPSARHFLRAYFSCDGWVTKTKTGLQVGCSSASKELILGIKHLLLRFGVPGKIRDLKRKVNGEDRIYYAWECTTAAALSFIGGIGFLGSKQEKARGLASLNQVRPKRLGRLGGAAPPAGFIWAEVKSIAPSLSLPVYDLEVEGTHCFLADSVLTHNTHWALTAPEPLAVISLDAGTKPIVDKFLAQGRKICLVECDSITDGLTHEDYKKEWRKFREAYRAVCHERKIRTLVIDTGTQMWELCRLSHFGKLDKILPEHYAPLNQEMRSLIKRPMDERDDLNVVLLHKYKKEWKESAATGRGKPTGRYEWSGFSDVPFIADLSVENSFDPATKEFYATVLDVTRYNYEIFGLELRGDMCTFPVLASMVFNNDLSYWSG